MFPSSYSITITHFFIINRNDLTSTLHLLSCCSTVMHVCIKGCKSFVFGNEHYMQINSDYYIFLTVYKLQTTTSNNEYQCCNHSSENLPDIWQCQLPMATYAFLVKCILYSAFHSEKICLGNILADFQIFRFSDFGRSTFRFSDFQISDFQIFRVSDFPIFRFSDFQIFRFSDFQIIRFSDF